MENHADEELLNIHEILEDSAFTEPKQDPMVVASFRAPDKLIEATMQICVNNGTDFSTFMRGVCYRLVKEYGGIPHDGQ